MSKNATRLMPDEQMLPCRIGSFSLEQPFPLKCLLRSGGPVLSDAVENSG